MCQWKRWYVVIGSFSRSTLWLTDEDMGVWGEGVRLAGAAAAIRGFLRGCSGVHPVRISCILKAFQRAAIYKELMSAPIGKF